MTIELTELIAPVLGAIGGVIAAIVTSIAARRSARGTLHVSVAEAATAMAAEVRQQLGAERAEHEADLLAMRDRHAAEVAEHTDRIEALRQACEGRDQVLVELQDRLQLREAQLTELRGRVSRCERELARHQPPGDPDGADGST